MSQITVKIGSAKDQIRFDKVLAQIVDIAASSSACRDAMITVHTARGADCTLKTIRCSTSEPLSNFITAYDENLRHA